MVTDSAENKGVTEDDLRGILARLGVEKAESASIRAFTSDEDGEEYYVWLIDTGEERRVLKRAKAHEIEAYMTFFREKKPYVSEFLGACRYGADDFFLTEYFEGEDLRVCSREKLIKAIDALTEMQDEFWQRSDLYDSVVTMDMALEGIYNRGRWLGSELLEKAYAAFVDTYRRTPRTLCHDDLLPINALVGDRAVLIDWEYAGVLPYLSSFARLIAHGREDRDAYFYLSGEDREFAVGYYYEKLPGRHGISREEYLRDLDFFLFYEHCEWIMLGNRYDNKEDERYVYCLAKAKELAARLIGKDSR